MSAVLCCAVLCCPVLCCAGLCRAVMCRAGPCWAMPGCAGRLACWLRWLGRMASMRSLPAHPPDAVLVQVSLCLTPPWCLHTGMRRMCTSTTTPPSGAPGGMTGSGEHQGDVSTAAAAAAGQCTAAAQGLLGRPAGALRAAIDSTAWEPPIVLVDTTPPNQPAPHLCRGYACCHSTVKQSYCVGAAGREAATDAAEQLAANMEKKAAEVGWPLATGGRVVPSQNDGCAAGVCPGSHSSRALTMGGMFCKAVCQAQGGSTPLDEREVCRC